MKFVNRIFLVLGAMSMFSLVQFDAIAVNDCSVAPKAGKYCQKPNNKPDCPTGCWCEGQATYHLEGRVSQDRVAEICKNKDASVRELRQLHYAKVYVCGVDYTGIPYGESDPHGFAGTEITYNTGVLKSYSEPKQSASTNCKVHPKLTNSEAGRFWNGNANIGCPPGCYCTGSNYIVDLDGSKVNNACLYHTLGLVNGFNIKDYLEERGVHYCPQGYTHALRGAKTITDCKNADGQNYVAPVTPSGLSEFTKPVNGSGLTVVSSGNGTAYHCDPGQYLSNSTGSQLFNGTGSVTSSFNKFGTTCTDCPAGWYCPGDDEKYQCTGTRKYSTAGKSACSTCPAGRQANSTHTGCEPATINMGSTDVVAQRVDASDLVAFEAMCLNGGTPHSVNFVRGNDSASGSTSSFNNRCQGDTITLPDCGFSLPEHTFNLWSCDNNIGTKVAGATFPMPDANVTCTAQWTAVPLGTHTVQYLCGDGFGIAPVDNSSYAHNDSVTLKSNTCTAPSGDTFYKWSCDNGIGTQAENATFYMPNANVTCTAQWTQTPPPNSGTIYTIILRNYDNSGTHSTIYEKYGTGWYSNAAATTTLNAATVPTRSNYTFRGYYTAAQTDLTASGGSGTRHITNSGGLPSNTTFSANTNLYAAWARNCDAETGCNCTLTVNNDGTVTYTTSAQTGYTLTSGDGTYHPVCTLTVNTADCNPGQYLPANSSTCVTCQDGYGCSGGTFEIKNFNQGREQCMPDRVSCQNYSACCYCPDGSNPNDTYSGCVNSNGTVVLPEDPDDPVPPVSCTTPGKYWNGDYCENCESGYFCPGDGDEYRCPLSGTTTTNRASCKLNVSKTQMYGNNGNKCWKYTGVSRASDYRDCVYGDHLENYPH